MIFRKKRGFDLIEVLSGCRKKDSRSQRLLVEQYYGLAKKICLRYASNMEEAEEIADDGFVKILSKPEAFDPEKPFEPWLKTIMIRTSIDFFRKKNNLAQSIEFQEYLYPIDMEDSLDLLSAQEILSLIQQLPPVYRMVFNLAAIEGYDHHEIGEMLGISPSTSRANLSKARAKVQEWIRQISPVQTQNINYHAL